MVTTVPPTQYLVLWISVFVIKASVMPSTFTSTSRNPLQSCGVLAHRSNTVPSTSVFLCMEVASIVFRQVRPIKLSMFAFKLNFQIRLCVIAADQENQAVFTSFLAIMHEVYIRFPICNYCTFRVGKFFKIVDVFFPFINCFYYQFYISFSKLISS